MTALARDAELDDAYRVFAVLATAYVVSQFFRVSNAVIAPELMASLSLTPEQLGAVTGAFFLAFGLMQIPTGVLLDRLGPRYTMSGLLVIAAIGAAVFALAQGSLGLLLGRALIGVGCSAGLMGALVAISRWFPPAKFSPLSSLLFTIGGMGILLATTPLAALSQTIGWRGAFWLMAAVTLLMAGLLLVFIKDWPRGLQASSSTESLAAIGRGLREVLGNRQLWHVCAIQFVTYATVLAIAGLWAGPYLNDVYGLDGVQRGNALLAINVSTLVGVMAFSVVERWINSRKRTILAGAALSVVVLLILALVPDLPFWLALGLLVTFGLVSSYVMLNHAHARSLLPAHLIGRGLTLQNLAVFLGVATLQTGSGLIVGTLAARGLSPAAPYRAVFAFLAVALVIGAIAYLPVRDVSPREESMR